VIDGRAVPRAASALDPSALAYMLTAEDAMPSPPIHAELELAAPPSEVFQLFTAGLGRWWPLAYTFSASEFLDARVETEVGGRWFERDRSGVETPWGDVRAIDRDRELVLGFAIGADRKPTAPEQASEVMVRFEPVEQGTRVVIEHRDFERHGASGAQLREGMASPQGWPLILAELRRGSERERSEHAAPRSPIR
jgi:uncharacterized protein YndB with AHSA1/START domain